MTNLTSMTGFARAEGSHGRCTWVWEVKTVNGKGLDLRFRLPGGFDNLEKPVRDMAQSLFKRGNFSIGLNIKWTDQTAGYQVNKQALDDLLAALPDIQSKVPDMPAPNLGDLLGVRGVVEPVEESLDDLRDALEPKLLENAHAAMTALKGVRDEEGARMADVLMGHLQTIEKLRDDAVRLAALQPEAITAKFKASIEEILKEVPPLPEEKIAQEVALLVAKADVREELDRLKAHCEAAHDLMKGASPVGRKLDFLCQEFNREANTLCSKSADVDLTRIGLDLKAAIEQFREQVQNIE